MAKDSPLTWSLLKPGMLVWLASRVAVEHGVWPEDLGHRAEARIWGLQDPRPWNGGRPSAVVRVIGVPLDIHVADITALERRTPAVRMEWAYLTGEAPRMPEPGETVSFRLYLEAREPDDQHDTGMRSGTYLGKGRWAVAGTGLLVPTSDVACWRRQELPKIYRVIEAERRSA